MDHIELAVDKGLPPSRAADRILAAAYKGIEESWIYANAFEFMFMFMSNSNSSSPTPPKMLNEQLKKQADVMRGKISSMKTE